MNEERKVRVKGILERDLPGCSVVFDSDSPGIRWMVKDSGGQVISSSYPDMAPGDMDEMTDQQLSVLLRRLCGLRSPNEPLG